MIGKARSRISRWAVGSIKSAFKSPLCPSGGSFIANFDSNYVRSWMGCHERRSTVVINQLPTSCGLSTSIMPGTITSTKFQLFNRQVLKVLTPRFCTAFDNISYPLGAGGQIYVRRALSSGRQCKYRRSLPLNFAKPHPTPFHIDVLENLPAVLYLHLIR